MPRCPDCNKFVSVEMAEPELSLKIGEDEVTGTVRLVQQCGECGAKVDVEQDVEEQASGFEPLV